MFSDLNINSFPVLFIRPRNIFVNLLNQTSGVFREFSLNLSLRFFFLSFFRQFHIYICRRIRQKKKRIIGLKKKSMIDFLFLTFNSFTLNFNTTRIMCNGSDQGMKLHFLILTK